MLSLVDLAQHLTRSATRMDLALHDAVDATRVLLARSAGEGGVRLEDAEAALQAHRSEIEGIMARSIEAELFR